MGYIYKLLDKTTEKYLNEGYISFSRMIIQFPEYEGFALNFIVDIKKKIDQNISVANIMKDTKIKEKIINWFNIYLKSLKVENNQKNREQFFSDMKIILYLYLNSYCTCFTKCDLFDEKSRDKYLENNSMFINKYNKTAVARINSDSYFDSPTPLSHFCDENDHKYTRSTDNEKQPKLVLHTFDIEYIKDNLEYTILTKFADTRLLYEFFAYLPYFCKNQKETRAKITFKGLESNSSQIANDKAPKTEKMETFYDYLFSYVINTVSDLTKNYPDYVYLHIDDFQIQNI